LYSAIWLPYCFFLYFYSNRPVNPPFRCSAANPWPFSEAYRWLDFGDSIFRCCVLFWMLNLMPGSARVFLVLTTVSLFITVFYYCVLYSSVCFVIAFYQGAFYYCVLYSSVCFVTAFYQGVFYYCILYRSCLVCMRI